MNRAIIVFLLAPLATCASEPCGIDVLGAFVSRSARLPLARGDVVVDAALTAAGEPALLAVAREGVPTKSGRAVMSAGSAQPPAFDLVGMPLGEGFSCRDEDCSYSVGGVMSDGWGVRFAGSGRFVRLPSAQALWLPFRNERDRGLYLSERAEETRAFEVTPDGIRRQWGLGKRVFVAPGWWAAQLLPDDSIALASLDREQAGDYGVLALRRLLGTPGEESVVTVPGEKRSDGKLNMALLKSGELVVVINDLPKLTAVLFNPSDASVRTIALEGREDEASAPLIAPTQNGCVIAWVDRERGEIRALPLVHGRPGFVAASIGTARDDARLVAVAAHDEEVVIVWQDGADLFTRRVPAYVSALDLLREAIEAVCGRFTPPRPLPSSAPPVLPRPAAGR